MMKKHQILTLHLKHIRLPLDNRFSRQIQLLIQKSLEIHDLKYKKQEKIVEGFNNTAQAIIEGLYQVYGTRNENCGLGLPTSKGGYGEKTHQINDHSHTVVIRIIEALELLGWAERRRGFKNKEGKNFPTSFRAIGELLDIFEKSKFVWREMGPIKSDVIVLKGYDKETRAKEIITFKDNNQIRKWRKNLQTYNHFLTQNAICLNRDNFYIDALVRKMSDQNYQVDWMFGEKKKKPRIFNFLHVQLRRIFARGRFDCGGRFYGGWWQFIPSEYRRYITINGLPTVEADYSELHPRLMYLNAGLEFPDGDLYDIGLRYDGIEYNKDVEPYKTSRPIIKTFINATINDDRGKFKLHGTDYKKLKMSPKELENLVVKRHPIIKDIKGKGLGLQFQFIDSQIAEKVMVEMMNRGRVCLPVHDSFICQEEYEEELRQLMHDSYLEIIEDIPKIKESERAKVDFEQPLYPNGTIDLTYTKNYYKDHTQTEFLSTFLEFQERKQSQIALRR